jgi:hypothetical protein
MGVWMVCMVQGRPRMVRKVKSKIKSMLIIFFDIKWIVHKEFFLAGQTVSSTCYCDVLLRKCAKTSSWTLATKNWLLHHNNAQSHTSFFTREFFTKSNITVISNPPYISLFPWLKIKVKGCHFDTIEVIEAELQVMLNTLTEDDFQDTFEKIDSRTGYGAYAHKGTTLKVTVVSRPKVSVRSDGSTSPRNCGCK